MKKCSACKETKNLSEFNFKIKGKGIYSHICRACSRIYIRSHYLKNKNYYLLKAHKRNLRIRDEIRTHIWEYLHAHACVDCGEKDPLVLEFDHISDKIVEISRMHRNYSLEQVKAEISKCQVRCANCHRRKTAKDRGWHKKFLRP